MDLTKIAGRIRERRRLCHITQADIAQKLGLTPQTVSKWERGMCAPDLDNLIDLSKILACTVDYLLCLDGETEKRCFIAIDGGGTKTEFLLFQEDGRILKRIRQQGTNPNVVGRETARDRLLLGISALMEHRPPTAIFAGIAGVISGKHVPWLTESIAPHTKGIPMKIASDIFNVIHSEPGIDQCTAVISGTGSSVFAFDGETLQQFGGWGYLFDGAGSGYDIGRDVLCACFAYDNGFGPMSLVTELAESRLGCRAIDILSTFYSGGRERIAAMAPVAFEAYRYGDPMAKEIIHRNLDRLIMLIQAAEAGAKTVMISGGLVANQDIFRPYMEEKLGPDMRLLFPSMPQIYGAAVAAMKLVDCQVDQGEFCGNFQQDYMERKKG